MFDHVASLWRTFPRTSERPDLQDIEVRDGLAYSTNGHLLFIELSSLPDGNYSYITGARLPNRLYKNFSYTAFTYFSFCASLDLTPLSEVVFDRRKKRVQVGDVTINKIFWDFLNVVEGDTIQAGAYSEDMHFVMVSQSSGTSIIAGMK